MCLHVAEVLKALLADAPVDILCVVNLQAVADDALSVSVLVFAVVALNHHLVVGFLMILQVL